MLKKYKIFILVVIVVIGVVVFYARNNSASYVLKQPMEITFSPKWVNQAQFAGEFVAKDLGYYSKLGLDVNINEFKLGGSVLEDLKSGRSDLGLMSANEFLVNYSNGEPIQAVAAFYQVSPFMLASLKSNPVNSPAELKGKKLGIKGGEGAEGRLVYELLLSSAGLSEKDVTYVYLPFGVPEQDDLTSGRVDVIGFYRDEIYHFDQNNIAYVPIYPEQYGSALYNDILVSTKDFIQEHPDAVRAFIKATVDGWKYAYKNKEQAIATTMKYVTVDNYKDLDYQKYILALSEDLMTLKNSKKIGSMDLKHWKKFYDTLYSRNLIPAPFDVSEAFTTEFIQQ